MKKSKIIASVICAALTFFMLTNCKEKAAGKSPTEATNTSQVEVNSRKETKIEAVPYEKKHVGLADNHKASYEEMKNYFNPDFSTVLAEETFSSNKAAKTSITPIEESENIIPGVRKLSDYQTQYSEKRADPPAITYEENEEIISTDPLEVEDWGPQDRVIAENETPVFYVIFSQPVRALAKTDIPSESSDIMKIEPHLNGVFKWYGTRHISFEATEAADPTIKYTISINKELKSLGGVQISGPTEFSTRAEDIRIVNFFGGYIKDSDQAYEWSTGALPAYANRIYIRLNMQTSAESLKEKLKIKIGEKFANYTLEPDYNQKAFVWYSKLRFDEEKNRSNSFIVTITDEIPYGTEIKASTDGAWAYASSYDTLKPLVAESVPSQASFPQGEKNYPFEIYFNQKLDKNTIYDNITFDFDVKLSEENCLVKGTKIEFFDLPVEAGKEYSLNLTKGIKDIYGQSLSDKSAKTYKIYIPDTKNKSYVKFIDSGTKMMEAQFPHKLLFEYQNIEDYSYYNIHPTTNPFDLENPLSNHRLKGPEEEGLPAMDTSVRDQRQFKEFNLDDYLNNGYGFVKFYAGINIMEQNYWESKPSKHTVCNTMTIQVTDLGITARIAINKAVLMVRSLSTGKPVENADVYLYPGRTASFSENSNWFAQGKTDKNGLAVIEFTEEMINAYENTYDQQIGDKVYAMVKKGDDRAVYVPSTHSPWIHDVDYEARIRSRDPIQRTFMFVDRGLYRPGEIVTFRGIDRNQVLGSINVHTGAYNISVVENKWNGEAIIEPITGELSESGGFYGSFKLPDNLDPGSYCIYYNREGGSDGTKSINFTVANFERLKIESSISTPDITYYAGDKITAELSADYLAGGSLNGADYTVNWYKQETSFEPSTLEAKDYEFGPASYSYGRTYYADGLGNLNSNGKASLSCNTEKITSGNPFLYRVETTVTDLSNQRIAASAGIKVHSSIFYAGLKRPEQLHGFAKKDQKLSFPFILVDTDGHQIDNYSSYVKELSYTLNHNEWTVVHEQSVDDTIYTRYEMQVIEDTKGTLKAATSGTIDITPTKSGWHTLKVSGKDKKGNPICTEIGFYVTGGDTFWYDSYNSESIKLTADQSQYNPGDKAQLLLESPLPSGDYLITVEREGIFTQEIRHFDSSANVIEIPISSVYVPVVYVSIASYSERHGAPTHKYGEPDLDKPKGYYGVAPLFVNPYVRAFSVQVEADKNVYRPGEEATLTLTATKGGKAFEGAELTVMAVDRGVIDLIDYHVPNPIDFFYNKSNFPLRVKGGDSRDLLMDPVTYSVKNLSGGDADEEKEDERKDFRPTALFEPVLITDKDGKATCTFKMPDNLTTYRITAFGVKDDLFALQEDEVRVQNPVNIQAVQPRMLRERDTAECGVLITNLDINSQNVTVSVEARVPTKNTAQDELEGRITVPGYAEIDGKKEYTVKVAAGGSSVVYFDVAAKNQGTVELVYTIKSEILNEKLISPIKIEKTYVYETETMIGSTKDGQKEKITEALVIPSYAKDGRGDISVTLDATRLGMLGSSVNYLFEYPYGCLEQQSSRVLPLIIFEDYIDVFGLNSKVSNIHKLVTSFTNSWAKSQFEDGAFPYWPDSEYISDYVSIRIAHVCAIALKNGYTASELGINLNSLCNYIASNAVQYSNDYSKYLKAYSAYVLSLFNHAQTKAILNTLYPNKDYLPLSVVAYMALAYQNDKSGDSQQKAQELAKMLRSYLKPSERGVTLVKRSRSDNYIWWYESETDLLATLLQLFVSLNPDDTLVDNLLFTLMMDQSHGYWHNTATTGRVLEAIYTYIKQLNLEDTDYTATASIDGKKVMTESFKGLGVKPKTLKLPFEDEIISSLAKDKEIPVNFEKEGKGRLFYTMELKYAIPDEMQVARDNGIKITYEILDTKSGQVVNKDLDKNPVLKLEDGKVYKATVHVESNMRRDYLALRAPIPSGAEILDSTFVTSASDARTDYEWDWNHSLSNKFIKDNEVQFFWDTFNSGSASVSFTFRTTRHGIYPVPPVQAECMYEPEIYGRSDGYLTIIE